MWPTENAGKQVDDGKRGKTRTSPKALEMVLENKKYSP